MATDQGLDGFGGAVAFALGSLTILCGLSILAGAIATTMLERRREAALWKTVGVTRGGPTLSWSGTSPQSTQWIEARSSHPLQ